MERRIAYFVGCTANYLDPVIGQATIRVLVKNGLRPVFPDQKCCGMPQLRYGDVGSALKLASFNVRRLAEADCDVVTACTTCALMLKHEYPRLLKGQEAEATSRRTFDISEYLAMLHERSALNVDLAALDLSLLYHAPCHLKALGNELVDRRLRLMRLIPGVSVSRIERGCCGMAGSFGSKRGNYDLSMRIGRALFEGIRESAPHQVATDCPTCKLQIEEGSGVTVTHPIMLFDQAYER